MDKAKYKQYVELIRSRLSDYRFYHSVCVAEAAVQLAERFGADVEQAYVAGILHDVMKEEEPSAQRAEPAALPGQRRRGAGGVFAGVCRQRHRCRFASVLP